MTRDIELETSLAWTWLEAARKIKQEDYPNVVCYPHNSMGHRVVEFYDSETDKVYTEWFITAPMLSELLGDLDATPPKAPKNPKKVRNEYLRGERPKEVNAVESVGISETAHNPLYVGSIPTPASEEVK